MVCRFLLQTRALPFSLLHRNGSRIGKKTFFQMASTPGSDGAGATSQPWTADKMDTNTDSLFFFNSQRLVCKTEQNFTPYNRLSLFEDPRNQPLTGLQSLSDSVASTFARDSAISLLWRSSSLRGRVKYSQDFCFNSMLEQPSSAFLADIVCASVSTSSLPWYFVGGLHGCIGQCEACT